MNIKATMYKLQKALLMKGQVIKINQMQVYFSDDDRMVTKYIVAERVMNENGKMKDETLIETFSTVDVVKFLAALYRGDDG